jgi:hypothetical protein
MPKPGGPNSPEPEEPSGGEDPFAQDPHVERLRPDPSAPPAEVAVLVGLAGKSDRPDRVRLYLNRALTYYAEFRREDVVYTEPVPPEQPPMVGLKATRVGIRADAAIEYIRASRARARDQFDLDVRLAPELRGPVGLQPQTFEPICEITFGTCVTCPPCELATAAGTCQTCGTCLPTLCNQATCDTCFTCATCQQTQCNQATCQTCVTCQPTLCNQATCQTCFTCLQTLCNQATCQTCVTCQPTQCNQATCQTCFPTQCNQATCQTCFTCITCDITCNPHVFTCGPNPQCRRP